MTARVSDRRRASTVDAEPAAVNSTPTRDDPDVENGLRLVSELLEFMQDLDDRVGEITLQLADLRADLDRLRRRAA